MNPNIPVTRSVAIQRALALLVLALALVAWWPGLATLAEQQIDAGLKRALISFTVARGLNAVLSVLQGTSVAAQPLGVGLTLTLGQVLEPVNRIVEQFSTVMLFASVAFGIQKLLVVIGSSWPVSAALSVAAALWVWAAWTGRDRSRWLSNLLVVLLLARFAVPTAVVASDHLFRHFLDEPYAASMQGLEKVRGEVQQTPSEIPQQGAKSWMDRLKDVALAPVNEVRQRYESIRAAAEQAIARMIQLIVIFVAQTVLFPLIVVWALVRAARSFVAPGRPLRQGNQLAG